MMEVCQRDLGANCKSFQGNSEQQNWNDYRNKINKVLLVYIAWSIK